jgi:hypothetical protein
LPLLHTKLYSHIPVPIIIPVSIPSLCSVPNWCKGGDSGDYLFIGNVNP